MENLRATLVVAVAVKTGICLVKFAHIDLKYTYIHNDNLQNFAEPSRNFSIIFQHILLVEFVNKDSVKRAYILS